MLHVINSLDIRELSKNMNEKIMECWKDPFDSPYLIVPNPGDYKWLKLLWIEEKKVLMNLKLMQLDSFLLHAANCKRNVKLLNKEILRFAIINELKIEAENEDSELVLTKKYICHEDKNIDWNRLYDLAEKFAHLFIEYDRIVSTNLCADNTEEFNNSEWLSEEKALYNRLFDDEGNLHLKNGSTWTKYITLHHEAFNSLENRKMSPVFLFGFSSIGRHYIDLIRKLSTNTEVYVYLQAEAEYKFCGFEEHGRNNLSKWNETVTEVLSGIKPDMDSLIPKYISAPSKLIEIEKVHKLVCSILNGDNPPMLSQIKIAAPNISDYYPYIKLVFDRDVVKSGNEKKPIPYSVADYSSTDSRVYDAVSILFRIFEKNDFSRLDFINLMLNPVIQLSNDIKPEYVDNWIGLIKNLNIYRDVHWQEAKKQLLLALITDQEADKLYPYSPISCDNDSIYCFINLIDKINNWKSLNVERKIKVDNLRDFINDFLSFDCNENTALRNEKGLVHSINKTLMNIETVLGSDEIPYKIVFISVLSAISSVTDNKDATDGKVQFCSITNSRISPTAYTFFIGMDSKSFPGKDKIDHLDLRKDEYKEDNDPNRKLYTLLCQMLATENKVYFSYINMDLKKGEELFKSSALNKISSVLNRKEGDDEERIPLDTSFWTDTLNGKKEPEEFEIPKPESDDRQVYKVRISELKSFLEEPMKFQIEQAIGYSEDIEDQFEEFEPTDISPLNENKLLRMYLSDSSNASYLEKTLRLTKKQIEEIEVIANSIKDEIKARTGIDTFDKTDVISFQHDDKQFEISGDFVLHKFVDNKLYCFDISSDYKTKNYIKSYVSSLALIAGQKEETSYSVVFYLFNKKDLTDIHDPVEYENISVSGAKKILHDICKRAYGNTEEFKYLPINDIDNKKSSYSKFIENIDSDFGPWGYFKKSKLVDVSDGLGYFEKSFTEDYNNECKILKDFIKFEI